jgi:hypothetical protein
MRWRGYSDNSKGTRNTGGHAEGERKSDCGMEIIDIRVQQK